MPKILCLLFLVALILLPLHQVKAEGTYANIGTADGADAGDDGINFSQGRVWTIDKYGKYIWSTEDRGGNHHWAYSNDLGATWTQAASSEGALTRASVAYDTANDKLHVIWAATDSNDGIIYRRYGITRDGSNNITNITREDSSNINLQLDFSGSRTLTEPVALWVNDGSNGILVAVWTKYGGGIDEVRASMRKLSLSAADGTGSNWTALDGTGDTFGTDGPAVAADKVYTAATGQAIASATIRGGTTVKKDDLYVFVQEGTGGSSDKVKAYRAGWKVSNLDWSNGWTTIGNVGAADSTSGYNLKSQLISKPVLDSTNEKLYVGWARWKDNTNGDTWSMASLDMSDNPSSTVDVYSALGTHSYAPTGDIMYDSTAGLIYSAYIESTTNGDNGSIDYKTYDGSSLSSQTRFYTSPGGSGGADGSADIPILYQNRSSNDRMLMAFRINGSLPVTSGDKHTIDFGYIALATPTPTPTPTTTPSNNNSSPSSNSSSSNSNSCPSSNIPTTPNLFQIDTAGTMAKLYFTTTNSTTSYNIQYGLTPAANNYSDSISYQGPLWILDRTINYLTPNTTYYFRVQSLNNCTPGSWSNVLSVKTKSSFADIGFRLSSLNPFQTTPTPSNSNSNQTASSCEYIVQSGDSLWGIAQTKLGSGLSYGQIRDQNSADYPSLKSSSTIKPGWKFKINC